MATEFIGNAKDCTDRSAKNTMMIMNFPGKKRERQPFIKQKNNQCPALMEENYFQKLK